MTGPKWPVSFPVDTNLVEERKGDKILFSLKDLDDSDFHLCLNLLAEVPHTHSIASSSIEEGAGRVESDLVDLTLSWWDGQTPDRGTDVP